MGRIVNVKCNKCGYETNVSVGAGKLFNDLEKVITLFDKVTADKIRELMVQDPKRSWSVTKGFGVCDKCKKISAIAIFKTTDSQGNVIELKARCQCGAVADVYDPEQVLAGERKIFCQICEDEVIITPEGFWD